MTLDLRDRETTWLTCDACGQHYLRLLVFVTRDSELCAVVNVMCHGPDGEVWLDATHGSWTKPYRDHVSFSCRVSGARVDMVDGPVARRAVLPHHGACLSGEQARGDARLEPLRSAVAELVPTLPDVSICTAGAPGPR